MWPRVKGRQLVRGSAHCVKGRERESTERRKSYFCEGALLIGNR